MKFSIVIPVYNSEKWIGKCIESVLNQTYTNYEIIVVDDISTDNSVKIAKDLLKNTKHKVIVNKSKRLSGGTRNVGICESTGDYIICIDGDDWLIDNQVLENINNKLNNEDVMFLGYQIIGNYNEDRILVPKTLEEAFNIPFPAPWLKAVKTSIYKQALFPEGTLYEDRMQNYILFTKAKTFTNLGKVTHCWNRLNQNATTFNPKWETYRFEYCGELYKLISQLEDGKIKSMLIEELKMYMRSCDEMVERL